MSVLHPQNREQLLSLLHPPEDFTFDQGVGTTYSLDLLALLVLPVGFTWMDIGGSGAEAVRQEPLKVLEAVRSMTSRLTVLCQGGQIRAPRKYHRLIALLEDAVVQAKAPHPHGSFHAKTWALRYVSSDGEVRYKLLVLSRNLTFDRCWDTVVALEGACSPDRKNAYSPSRPLRSFMEGIAKCSVQPLTDIHQQRLEQFASELARTEFEPVKPFRELAFHPIGLGAKVWEPLNLRIKRMMAVSPFVDCGFIERISDVEHEEDALELLVTRPETIDELGPKPLQGIEVKVLSEVPSDPTVSETDSPQDAVDDSGLHAKLYLVETGHDCTLLTGSANATRRGFERNVEFLIGLTGSKSKVGIDAVLDAGAGGLTLRSVLETYEPRTEAADTEAVRNAELRLDEWSQAVAALPWRISVLTEAAVEPLTVRIDLSHKALIPDSSHIVSAVTPIAAQSPAGVGLPIAVSGADFHLAEEGDISAFLTVSGRLTINGVEVRRMFAVHAALVGAPVGRLQRLISSEISRSGGLVEWLYLMLGEEPRISMEIGDSRSPRDADTGTGRRVSATGLFETLVRAAVESPERIAVARQAIDSLRESGSETPDDARIRALLQSLSGQR